MVIAHIVHFLPPQAQTMIPLPLLPLPVLPLETQVQSSRSGASHARHRQRDAIPGRVARRLRLDEDITGHKPGQVAHRDLDRRADRALVVAPEVIRQPDDLYGGADPKPALNEVQGRVAHFDGDQVCGEEHCVADGVDGGAEEDEAEAVLQTVRSPCREEGDDEAGGVDGDRLDLGFGGGVAEAGEDGGEVVSYGVVRDDGPEVHEAAAKDF